MIRNSICCYSQAALRLSLNMSSALLVPLIAVAVAVPAQAQSASTARAYNIPAQPLGSALREYMRQSGVQVGFPSEIGDNVKASAVTGSFSAPEALSHLLAGTGLTFRFTGANTVTLERAPQSADGAVNLGPVRVEGQGDGSAAPQSLTSDPNATEGTRAYTGSRTTTASRMPLTVQETPQSVTVVTRQRIDDFQLQTLDAVLTSTVGINSENNDSDRTYFTSRGFYIANLQIDGIASLFPGQGGTVNSAAFPDSFLYDRIEIVRGATGLLSATGDPAATVNLVRKKPGKEFAAAGFATIGSRDAYRGGVDLSLPIAAEGAVRGRVIGVYEQGDSYRARASDERLTLSALLEFDLSPTTLLRVAHRYQDTASRGTSYAGLPRYFNDGTLLNLPRTTNLAPGFSRWDKTEHRSDITLEQQLGEDWKIVAAIDRSRLVSHARAYFLGFGLPDRNGDGMVFADIDGDGRRTQWNYDVHLNGRFGLLGREHMLMFGVNGYRVTDRGQSGGVAPLDSQNVFAFNPNIPEPARGPRTFFSRDVTKMDGVFGSLRLSLADPLHVIVGGRLTDWRLASRFEDTDAALVEFYPQEPGRVFTPFYGATFDITPRLSVYASYADLFTPQSERDVDNRFIEPIVGSNKEVGLKATFLDERLIANLAYYVTERDNVAELVLPEVFLPDGSSAYRSTGKGNKTKGFEIELSGAITPRWNIYAGFAQNRTRNAAGDLTRRDVPQRTFKGQTTWRPPVLNNRLTVGGGLDWRSKATNEYLNPEIIVPEAALIRLEQHGFALVSLLARFEVTDRFSIALNADNLFDKTYYTAVYGGHYGEPRNVQLTVNAKF